MKLEFKKRVLEIDLYGEPVSIDFPTVGQYRKYQTKLLKENASETDVMIEILKELGMTQEQIDGLEPSHLKQVIDSLMGSEKK